VENEFLPHAASLRENSDFLGRHRKDVGASRMNLARAISVE